MPPCTIGRPAVRHAPRLQYGGASVLQQTGILEAGGTLELCGRSSVEWLPSSSATCFAVTGISSSDGRMQSRISRAPSMYVGLSSLYELQDQTC